MCVLSLLFGLSTSCTQYFKNKWPKQDFLPALLKAVRFNTQWNVAYRAFIPFLSLFMHSYEQHLSQWNIQDIRIINKYYNVIQPQSFSNYIFVWSYEFSENHRHKVNSYIKLQPSKVEHSWGVGCLVLNNFYGIFIIYPMFSQSVIVLQ